MENDLYFLTAEFWTSPELLIVFSVSLFSIVLGRYLVLAILYRRAVRGVKRKRLNPETPESRKQWVREIRWAALSSLVFTVLTILTVFAYQQGFTRIYADLREHSTAYFIFSIAAILILYETYYYWLHRWMHRPSVFRIVHKVHHDSIHTSVFTSFAFHPLEALLQFVFLPVIVCLIPVHYYALGIVLILMTISAIINHAGVEIFPKGFQRHRIGRWFIGATHHDLHHKEYRTNFGLYFTFWDKWMNTESKHYDAAVEKVLKDD